MTANKRVTACMIIIGNEILSGRTQDSNLAYLATALNELGVQLVEARVVPDVEDVIVDTVNECRSKFDNVFTTGGIGPTHDDITADCIAKAFGTELEMHPEVVEMLQRREAPPDVMASRMRMARIPKGAELIGNPSKGPPGFQVENVFVLAGVPQVMQAMLGTLTSERLGGTKPVRSRSIGAYLSEGEVASGLREIQSRYQDVDLGSYPFFREDGYGTNLIIRGTDEQHLDAVKEEVRALIVRLGAEPHEEL